MKANNQVSQDFMDAVTDKIKVTKIIHKGYAEWEGAKEGMTLALNEEKAKGIFASDGTLTFLKRQARKSYFGKYQYFYENSRGKISLIQLALNMTGYKMTWELGLLGSDEKVTKIERFSSKKQAEKRIAKYLGGEL